MCAPKSEKEPVTTHQRPPKPVLSSQERVVFEATCLADKLKYGPTTAGESPWAKRPYNALANPDLAKERDR